MAAKKKKKTVKRKPRALTPQALPMPEFEEPSVKLWPLGLLVLAGFALYFGLRAPKPGPIVTNNLPQTRETVSQAAVPATTAAINRPAALKGNLAGAEVLTWNRSKDPKVTFKVMRAAGESAEVRIFTSKNKPVRLLQSEAGERQWVSLVWDGLDSKGKKVARGSYFARISRDGGDVIQELVIE